MINIVDRSPLDPIAFSKTSGERRKRAAELRQLYARSKAGPCRGKVVLLAGNPEVMHARIVDRHKQGSPDYIGDLQNRFLELWAQAPAGVKKLNCVDLDLSQLVKRISRVIHLDDYEEVDFSELLDRTTS
jgi:hypothetical protein